MKLLRLRLVYTVHEVIDLNCREKVDPVYYITRFLVTRVSVTTILGIDWLQRKTVSGLVLAVCSLAAIHTGVRELQFINWSSVPFSSLRALCTIYFAYTK